MRKILVILLLCFFFVASILAKDRMFYALDGKETSYQEISSSPKTILFFWTSWCHVCRSQLIRFNETCPAYEGVNILYINLGENSSTVKKFAKYLGLKDCIGTKILLDTNTFLADKFSIIALPTFIFLKKGVPIHRSYYLDSKLIKEVFADE